MNERQDWAERRLASFCLGILPEEEEAELREILEGSPQLASLLQGSDPDSIGHLPPALLARWQQAGASLGPAERELVLEHLADCAGCLEELELVGGSIEGFQSPNAPPMRSSRSEARHPPAAGASRGWGFASGAVLGIAAGIVLMLVVPRTTPTDPQDGETMHGRSLQVVVPQSLRSGSIEPVTLKGHHQAVLLALALPRTEERQSARLLVRGTDEALILDTGVDLGPGAANAAQIVVLPEAGWNDGRYAVELVIVETQETRPLGGFAIRIAP